MLSRTSSIALRRTHILIVLLVVCASLSAQAQDTAPGLPISQATFDRWVSEGPTEQVAWQPRAFYVGLSGHQRLLAQIEVTIPMRELSRRPREGQVIFLVEVGDSAGRKYHNFGVLPLQEVKENVRKDDLRFSWRAFVMPGEYQVTIALYHGATREHNLTHRVLSVPSLNHDPLPEAWREEPALEFLAPISDTDLDFFFRPDIKGHLHLPLDTRQPVRVRVIADFTTSDLFGGSHVAYLRYLSAVLPTLKTFSQIEVSRGTVDIATLNLTQRQVSFEQQDVKALDWPRLKKTLAGLDPGKVSVQALHVKHATPGFLKEEVSRRMAAAGARTDADPLQVFIVITSPLGIYSFHGMNDDPLPSECHCVMYYLQYESSRRQEYFEAAGSVKRMFRPMKVHSFTAHNALDLRRALGVILREVSQM